MSSGIAEYYDSAVRKETELEPLHDISPIECVPSPALLHHLGNGCPGCDNVCMPFLSWSLCVCVPFLVSVSLTSRSPSFSYRRSLALSLRTCLAAPTFVTGTCSTSRLTPHAARGAAPVMPPPAIRRATTAWGSCCWEWSSLATRARLRGRSWIRRCVALSVPSLVGARRAVRGHLALPLKLTLLFATARPLAINTR